MASGPMLRGVMIARLLARFPYLIIVEPDCIFLRQGMRCKYAPGTVVNIVYAETDDGVKDVISIQAAQ